MPLNLIDKTYLCLPEVLSHLGAQLTLLLQPQDDVMLRRAVFARYTFIVS